ncbi:hypothetical protein [Blastococcus atacamensis]|uniref:hypothetical protein n=1 Tax=Blastococcus atacamensis TaxID=2070508 RepID=UPI0013000A1C|nr:hypothetical protein [Blastococcus atacamensis]
MACASFGILWWAAIGDAVLGVIFLVLAALQIPSYYLFTQTTRLRAKRDAERQTAEATGGRVPGSADLGAPSAPGPSAGEIVVERPTGYYFALLRRYWILIDGRRVGAVKRGATLRTTVTPGPHTVVARIDWTGSPSIDVDVPAGGRVVLDVEPSSDPIAGMFSTDKMLSLRVNG